MTPDSVQTLRLGFKRAFSDYYLDLRSPAIADPTEVFSACWKYLSALLDQLGRSEFMNRLDDETTDLAGQLEQDLRRRTREQNSPTQYDDLEDRLRECFEHAVVRLEQAGRLGGGKS